MRGLGRRTTRLRPGTGRGLAAGLAVLLCLGGAQGLRAEDERPEKDPDSVTWYAEVLGRGERGSVVTHQWSKGRRFRSHLTVAGRPIATIVNGEWYYTLDLATRSGIGIKRAPRAVAQDEGRERPFGLELEELLRLGGEEVGKDVVGGAPCTLYRVTNAAGRLTVCADPTRRLPIRVERYDRVTKRNDGRDYLTWLRGIPIADGFFEPPADFSVDRLELREYRTRARLSPVGPAPPLHAELLYGRADP